MRPRVVLLLLLLAGCALLVYWLLQRAAGPARPGVDAAVSRRSPGRGPARPASVAVEVSQAIREHAGQASGRLVVRGGWGGEPGQFGRQAGPERNPEGPMSLVVDGSGSLLVLDEHNRRVQRFGPDGRLISSLTIGSQAAQDLAIDDKGRTLVLDRLGQPGIEVYGADGKLAERLPVVGGLVREGGAITGVFADKDGVYVENEHDDLVRVADGAGKPTGLTESMPGRPTRDGRLYLKAGIIDKAAGRVYVQAHDAQQQLVWETPLNLGRPLLHVLLLDSDRQGHVYLGVEVGREDPTTHSFSELATLVMRLGASSGVLDGVLTLPPCSSGAVESFRPLTVGDDGTVYQMVVGPKGVTVTAYRF